MTAGDLTTHTSIRTSFLAPGRGIPVHWSGMEVEEQSWGLNLSRISAPRREPPFPCQCEDLDKVPDKPILGPPGSFLPQTQKSHSSHRPTRSHVIWLLPWQPALLAPGFTPGSYEGHPSMPGTFQCVPTSEPL